MNEAAYKESVCAANSCRRLEQSIELTYGYLGKQQSVCFNLMFSATNNTADAAKRRISAY